MIRCVPVLREDNVLKALDAAEDWSNDFSAVSDGQCPAGAEIVLYVDDNEYVAGADLD